MGKIRYEILSKLKKVNIISIADVKKVNIKGVKYFRDYKKIINNKKINTVFICTPNYLNNKILIASLKNGKRVFCEKPPCISKTEMKKLNNLNIKYKKNLTISFNHRFHESIAYISKILKNKKIGKPIWVRARYGKKIDSFLIKNWRFKSKFSGGGILIDQGIHLVDLIVSLFNFQPKKIQTLISSNFSGRSKVEDNVFLQMRDIKKKLDISLQSTMADWRYLFSLEILLSNGHIILNGLKTPSGRYGKEKLTIKNKKNKIIYEKQFNIDRSFEHETLNFINKVQKFNFLNNEKIQNRVMQIIFRAYANN